MIISDSPPAVVNAPEVLLRLKLKWIKLTIMLLVLAGALAVGAYRAAVVGVNFFRRSFHSLRNAHYEFMGIQYYQG
ncbi:MAG: hypothetical protein LBN19_01580 [Endomicrobium sp.]|jgi:hypothetical protein|nr:hypothetical protein [Endomicrobium sp.]